MDEITSGSGIAQGNGLQQLVERDRFSLVHRAGVGLVALADPDGIDDDEVVLGPGVRVTALRSSALITRTPRPFICSKKLGI